MDINRIYYRHPRSVFLNITGRCNLNCIYCSSGSINSPCCLSPQKATNILQQLWDMGVVNVTLTGGEPLLYQGLEELISDIVQHAHVTINTNGILIPKYQNYFIQFPYKKRCDFKISVDSPIKVNNQRTRGNYDIEGVLNNVQWLIKAGYRVSIMCTATKYLMIEDLNAFHEYARLHPQISIMFNGVKPCGKAEKAQWNELRPTDKIIGEIMALVSVMPNVQTSLKLLRYELDSSGVVQAAQSSLQCGAGTECIAISDNGDVYPCTAMNICMGNLFETNLMTICQESTVIKRLKKLREKTMDCIRPCSTCIHRKTCDGGCRANALGYYGKLEAPDPYCNLGKEYGI